MESLMAGMMLPKFPVLTIGRSAHSTEDFIALLIRHGQARLDQLGRRKRVIPCVDSLQAKLVPIASANKSRSLQQASEIDVVFYDAKTTKSRGAPLCPANGFKQRLK